MKKFQKVLSIVLTAAMLLGLLSGMTTAFAEESTTPFYDSGYCGTNVTYMYNGSTKTLTINGMYSSSTMTDFARGEAPWYEYSGEISTVNVTNVRHIGNYAFNNLVACTAYSLPSTLTTIGAYAFSSNNALSTITVPPSVTKIGEFAFFNTGLTYSSFPLTADISYGNEDLTDSNPLYAAANVTELYSGISGSLKWVIYRDGTLSIAPQVSGAMSTMTNYTQGNAPWSSYSSSIKTVKVEAGVLNIGTYAFYGLTNLTSVTIGENVSRIGAYAFYNCSKLPSVVLPASVVIIEDYAFYGCVALTAASSPLAYGEITISTVGGGNASLMGVLAYASSGTTDSGSCGVGVTYAYNTNTKTLEISGSGMMTDYVSSTTTPWQAYRQDVKYILVGDGVRSIGNYAFADMMNVQAVSIGNAVNTIGASALKNCAKLTYITLPENVFYVYSGAFSGCSSLAIATYAGDRSALTIMDGNYELSNALNYGNSTGGSTSTPTVPDYGTVPGTEIFWQFSAGALILYSTVSSGEALPSFASASSAPWAHRASQITSITMHGITSIGSYAFAGMTQLSSVTFASNTTQIGSYAFMGASSLRSLSLPSSLTTIMAYAFYSCTGVVATTPNTLAQMTLYTFGNEGLVLNYNGGSTTGGNTGSGGTTTPDTNTGSCGVNLIYTFDETTGTLNISGTGAMETFANAAYAPWYEHIYDIKHIVISDGVTNISAYAFYHAYNLETLRMGNTLTRIGSYAFNLCRNLTSAYVDVASSAITIETGNVYLQNVLTYGTGNGSSSNPGTTTPSISNTITGTNVTWSFDALSGALIIAGTGAIPDYSASSGTPWYAYNSYIKRISVYSGVTSIGDNAFAGMTGVVDVFVAGTVTSIGEGAFRGCSSIETMQLSSGLETIESAAFRGCAALKTLALPTTLKSLGSDAFRECVSLESVSIPASVTTLANDVFNNCIALEDVTFAEGLTSIGDRAFLGCVSLKALDFPATLTVIGTEAFFSAEKLTSVNIHSTGVFTVKASAFASCIALSKAVYENARPTVETGNAYLTQVLVGRYDSGSSETEDISWSIDRTKGILTLSGSGIVNDASTWKSQLIYADTIIFGEGITGIGVRLLSNNTNVKQVEMADTVVSVGEGAFANCTSLESVKLSSGLRTIGESAFSGCSALTSAAIPAGVTELPDRVFADCTSLESASVGNNLVKIGQSAFENCNSLRSFSIPASLTTIGNNAFKNCSLLSRLNVTKGGITKFKSGIFGGCAALTTVYFNGTQTEWSSMTAGADTELRAAILKTGVNLTISYLFSGTAATAAPSVTVTGEAGETIKVESPSISHYTPDKAVVELTLSNENRIVYVQYMPNVYELTIQYCDDEGNLLETVTKPVMYGQAVNEPTPTREGYTPDQEVVKISKMEGDTTVTVTYRPRQCVVTIIPVDTDGNPIGEETYAYGIYHGSVTAEAPEIPHYTPKETEREIEDITSDMTIEIEYEKVVYELEIECKDEDGYRVGPDITVEICYGDPLNYELPELEGGWIPVEPMATLAAYNGEESISVTYRLKTFTVQLHFVEVDSDGHKMLRDDTVTVTYGNALNYPVPTIEGYTTEQTEIRLDAVTEEVAEPIVVEYTRAFYKLTIELVDMNGAALGTQVEEIQAGSPYEISLNPIEGYVTTGHVLKGTMGKADVTMQVTLTAVPPENQGGNDEKVDDEKTPGDENPPEEDNDVMMIVIVVALVVVVLAGAAMTFYIVYLKKKV
ncbi:MAG: leucine-rich repeat protein [Clostridia bacterium]|nr:leucine-rich repeat protein [Clostridia bacterium]